MNLNKRAAVVIAAVIMILGAGMRLLRAVIVEMPYRDSIGYVNFARTAAGGGWAEAYRACPEAAGIPPLLPAILTAGELTGIGAAKAGIVLMLLSSLLTAAAIAMIARELWQDRRLTLAALLLGSILPALVRSSVEIMRDPPYWCFALWALFFLMYALNRQRKSPDTGRPETPQTLFRRSCTYWAAVAAYAVCTALAILTRREGVELLLYFALWLLCFGWARKNFARILAGKVIAAMLAALLIAVPTLTIQFSLAAKGSTWQALQLRSLAYYSFRFQVLTR